ncbi:MAG TPA: PEP/pyruvate-binding domain-containing protein, partial [Chloroflexia bacterium]|nr:PEP/pyruvate-binding domain-containing protein [Chloroflexia bacterium]
MDRDIILQFDDPAADLAAVGGKGANLARLARAGFPVPPGFLVGTAGYRAFVEANDLQAAILTIARAVPAGDPAALEVASAAIRDRFAAGTMPPAVAAALAAGYAELGSPPVAVRSSATAEDLPDMSFAGQQDTYLNIVGPATLQDAVVRCWASLWTARALGYRARNGIAPEDVALAVVVQEMVPSEASGVLFTANPLTGLRDEVVIDATLGLGEALVSGLVEPDHYVVDATATRILHKTLGDKALAIHGQAGGGTVTVSADAAKHQALPDAAIRELAALGQRVAAHYGTPQDLEWGWADARLYLLQARPITSLFPLPAGVSADPLRVLFSFASVQGVLDPYTPFGQDAIQMVAAGGARMFGFPYTFETQPVLRTAAERLFIDITGPVRHRIGRRLISRAGGALDPGAYQALSTLLADPRLAATRGRIHSSTLGHLGRGLGPVLPRLLLALIWPEARYRAMRRQTDAAIARLTARG